MLAGPDCLACLLPTLQCKAAVDTARQQVARLINAATPSEVALTSCGTEADNWAITGVVMAARRKAAAGSSNGSSNGNGNGHASSAALPHVVTSSIEHPAVLACLKYLKQQVGAGCRGMSM